MNRFAIRTPNAEQVAEFYSEVFELKPVNGRAADGYHLTDGRVTLSILKWSADKFSGMLVKRPGPDHIGFRVEGLAAFKAHVAEMAGANPLLAPTPLGGSPESDTRRELFRSSANGEWQIADPDGNWLDISCDQEGRA